MRQVTLTQIEATGIQEYIFGANNLRQSVGASELVFRATTEWTAATLRDLGIASNGVWDSTTCELKFDARNIADATARVEVVYAGGGSALILFDGATEQIAREFTRRLTRRVLREARGLSLVVEHAPFDWDNTDTALAREHLLLRRRLAQRKLARAPDVPLTGLGVTAMCEFTGLPVVGRDPVDGTRVSQVVLHKLEAFRRLADNRHRELCGLPAAQEFVYDFDQFGEKNEASYLAVVHADGNRMGKRFQDIAAAFPAQKDNAEYIRRLRVLSDAVNAKGKQALRAATNLLAANFADGKYAGIQATLDSDRFPFRLIVFGGDDITFVTDGRLGLPLTAYFLRQLAKGNLPDPTDAPDKPTGAPLYARAGIAIVKSHYPFARAYQLADDLADSAKHRLDDLRVDARDSIRKVGENGHVSLLDWHVSTSGVVLPLDQIRKREYVSVKGHRMLQRPLCVTLDHDWYSWEAFAGVLGDFQDPFGAWADRRNKIKALHAALRDEEEGVKLFRANYGMEKLPPVVPYPLMSEQGWSGNHCGYFDALEAYDFFVPLSEKEQKP